MSEYTQVRVESPCIGICAIDESNGFCLGCYRTVDEIKAWFDMSQDEKKDLLTQLDERQLSQTNFDA
ncbi:hypothetical protein GALL_112400 [mine drainage metagenome]|uniref:Fe-S protein n=1 Tax=mine drainage metagenome TaxID=410659 RepID=A0A1J5SDT6_9ZZZZ